jgi:hypothetical protein
VAALAAQTVEGIIMIIDLDESATVVTVIDKQQVFVATLSMEAAHARIAAFHTMPALPTTEFSDE